MTARNYEVKRRDLSEARDRLRPKDRHGFHVTTRRLLRFEKDWDATVDGEVVARCSDLNRLLDFMEEE